MFGSRSVLTRLVPSVSGVQSGVFGSGVSLWRALGAEATRGFFGILTTGFYPTRIPILEGLGMGLSEAGCSQSSGGLEGQGSVGVGWAPFAPRYTGAGRAGGHTGIKAYTLPGAGQA